MRLELEERRVSWPKNEKTGRLSDMELVTVIGSNHFGLDEYIKQYLLQPDLPFISFVKIGLRYYITPELIVQLNELKEHLNVPSYEVSYKWYTRVTE